MLPLFRIVQTEIL